MEKLIQFFDFSQPCPAEIPNCEHVRRQYTIEAEQLKAAPGCWGCKEKSLKSKYTTQLQQYFIKP